MPTTTAKKTAKKSPNNLPTPKFLKPKPIKVITRKVLQNIADGIYDRMTGSHLNLCSGTLQNGPDPACATRSMHCGLGELYFVITGKQPAEDKVDENDVVDLVADRSTIGEHAKLLQKKVEQAKKQIKKLGLPEHLTTYLVDQLNEYEPFDQVEEFRNLIDNIPNENDEGPSKVEDNTPTDFKRRAQRVANVLRQAADLLPR